MTQPTSKVRHPLIAESLAELLDRIRGQRNDYTHLWRCLRFVRKSPEIGAIADEEAAIELGKMLTLQLSELRVVECQVAEDLWALVPELEPAPPRSAFAALHSAHPWALHEALEDAGTDTPAPPVPDPPRIASLWLLDEATLSIISRQGREARYAREEEERREEAEARGDGAPWQGRAEDVLHVVLRRLHVPDNLDATAHLGRWAQDAWTRMGVRLEAERMRWSPASDPLPLARLLHRLGLHNARFRRIGHVLLAIHQGVQNWLGTLPPGFPTLPPTQRQDREFLFGMQRTLIRDGARRVAALAQELFPGTSGKGPPTPIVAFTEDVRSRVNVDGDRIAIFCPLYFQDAPRYLVSILHECAHGFIPDVGALYQYGAFAPWLEGPVTHAVHRVMSALGGPDQMEEAYDCVAEILADCIGIALGGPGLVRSLLAVTIAETPFAEEVEVEALPDPFIRCRILVGALDRVWQGGASPFRQEAVETIGGFLEEYFAELRRKAEGVCSPAHAPPNEAERREAARLLRFDAAVRVALTDFAVTVLEGVGMQTIRKDEAYQSPRKPLPEHWVFRYGHPLPEPIRLAADRLVERLAADGDDGRAGEASGAEERSFLTSAFRTPAAPSRCEEGEVDEGRLVDANTLHLLWADWFRASPLDRCRGPQRDLARMVQLALCLVRDRMAPEGRRPRRRIEPATAPNYFGRGRPLALTLLDNSAPATSRAEPVGVSPDPPEPDPVLGAPVGPQRWFHALGQFDYALVVDQSEERASYPDPFDFGSHPLPYYTRQQELRLLDPRRIHTLTARERRRIESDPARLVTAEPLIAGPVFHFLHRVLFDRPGTRATPPPELVADILRAFGKHPEVRVRGLLRGFTWAEMGVWLECRGDLAAATAAITAASTQRDGHLPAQTHTLTLIRWTPAVAALHDVVSAEGRDATGCIRALCSRVDAFGGSASPPVRFLMTLYWPRGRRGERRRAGGTEVEAALDALQGALTSVHDGPRLEFADVLGDEDFQAWLDVPALRLRDRPAALARMPAAVCTQALTALLLLYTSRALGAGLGVTEVTSQVALPRRGASGAGRTGLQ